MKRVLDHLSRLLSSEQSVFLLLGMILLVTFGPFLFTWGFYFDDWPMIYLIKTKGDILQFYSYDRPLAGWTDIALQTILGTNPLLWQFANLIAHWFSVVAFWWSLNLLWPGCKRQAFYTALLFAIYPVFFQQPIAVTYTHAFIWYTCYFLSLGLMILAIRKRRIFLLLTLLSIIFGVIHIFSVEYFWGLELLRPVILWFLVTEPKRRFQKLKRVLVYWTPWALLLLLAAIGRFLIFPPIDANKPIILFSLIQNPIQTLLQLTQTVLQDILYIVISSWTEAVQTSTIGFDSPILLLAWGAVILVGITAFLILQLMEKDKIIQNIEQNWSRQALLVGMISLPVSLIPAWVAGRQVVSGLYADRFALPAMVGASLVIVSLIDVFISRLEFQRLTIALLLGLAVGIHVRSENTFRRDWDFARDFFWQLYWRVPALQSDTALISERGVLQYTTKYSLALAINVLYPVPLGTTDVPYWTFELDDLDDYSSTGTLLDFESIQLQDSIRNISFSTSSQNIILFSYQRLKPHCLWVLSSSDSNNPYLEELTEEYLDFSNLDRIIPEPASSDYPDPRIFGPEPPHTWCYFYQKAELARQMGEWDEVVRLGDEVHRLEYEPSNSYEWLPFIEGYIHQGNWQKAYQLTKASFDNDNRLNSSLCAVWEKALEEKLLADDAISVIEPTLTEMGCTLH